VGYFFGATFGGSTLVHETWFFLGVRGCVEFAISSDMRFASLWFYTFINISVSFCLLKK